MSLVMMIFGFLTVILLIVNILIARKIIKVNFIWHKRIAYLILLTGVTHFILILLYYGSDILSVIYLVIGGVVTYTLLILQILIGKNIIKSGIKTHRILGYVVLFFAVNHGVFAMLYKYDIIHF